MKQKSFRSEPRLSLAMLLVALIMGVGLLILGIRQHGETRADLEVEIALEAAARDSAREAPQRLARDRQEANRYQQVRASGFLDRENRAGWVSALGKTRSELGLDTLSWRLAPRVEHNLATGLFQSAMDISISRVDAEGLDTVLAKLTELAPGRFTVERCALTFEPDGRPGQAECRLNWWTWEDVQHHH